ncbi:hypothetical protein GCM10028832_44890 [Streptomyces sparsus]
MPGPGGHPERDRNPPALGKDVRMPRSATAEPAGQENKLLGIYLNDHLAAATAAVDLARRVADGHADTAMSGELDRLTDDVEQDRATLLDVMRLLDVPVRKYKIVAARLGESIGRAKPNGRLVRTSPLRSVVELDGLLLAVRDKALVWRTLTQLAEQEQRLDADRLDSLLRRAQEQTELLERLRSRTVGEVLVPAGR